MTPAKRQPPGVRHQEQQLPMQIHRIPRHARNFTVIDNAALRDKRLSHTARGILAYVLSLPSGAKVNVRTLSDEFPQGRRAVSNARAELRELGYWVTRTERDPRTKRIVSSVDVHEAPGRGSDAAPVVAAAPVPTRVGTGESGASSPGGVMDYEKDGMENPPLPPAADRGADAAGPYDDEGARILRRLGVVDARLRLSERSVRELVPEVSRWLDRGASAAEIVEAVTAGLPAKVYSAARLVADRLVRKLPARKRAWREVFECPECRDPLPWGQESGVCRGCAESPGWLVGTGGSGRGDVRRTLRERERGPLGAAVRLA
ncbi:hypothetical protein [Streptomyces sp. VRA16 Mangrove soil]|uniref:hypothetical protein n=1 Tax=Streptomyces sp. VRA16 Mangrove soil TaxID=2817434 RepID=UPI001A9D6747|nr:hypothetical protein [Streptomyces sp. VRA16 Mangrove soil]MBO1337698.1 hypothetical protein [Streptomyces sp. VRA16 Mangrove soil]